MPNFTPAVTGRFSQNQNFLDAFQLSHFLTHGSPLHALRAHENSAIIFINLRTGSALGEERGKNRRARKKMPSGSLGGGGERVAPSVPSPQTAVIFQISPSFFFFPTADPGPRLNLEMLQQLLSTNFSN